MMMRPMRVGLAMALLMTITVLTTIATAQQQEDQQPPPPMLPVEEVGMCSRTFFSALVQLIPCRAAVAPFSPIPPTESCCAAVVTLGRPCLCLLANGPPLSGIDRSMALQLPQRCFANFPPCDVIN
ncbi:Bifunctional inhibitor/lipid-transfer protein/seed storage 2S albumin superfamily protein [Raphanus sativus]|uniref:Lipid-transfer protein DIR1 n=1 Tax=Raphanus sativus TaxID=3726 RepID=A0A9W3DL33_RAPSA|nr:putative lipid-transfer protein DIR1 [Raphanus sativus]KAJ4900167.1 Bifunctional inhibitor/lipid-transfer protein/seed storage 2S albumin superfamily protein [Raphanus sativus]